MKEGINAGHGDRSAGMLQPIIKNVLEKIGQDIIITDQFKTVWCRKLHDDQLKMLVQKGVSYCLSYM